MLRLTIALTLILAAPAAARPGDLDRSFGLRGRTAFTGGPGYTWASDVAVRDGGVLVAGMGDAKAGVTWVGGATLARLTSAGRVQGKTFLTIPAPPPFYAFADAQRIAVLPDGWAVIATELDWSGSPHLAVFRVRADGTPDASFGTDGVAIATELPYLAGMGVDGAGRIVIAANRDDGKSSSVVRFLPDGALDPSYGAVSLPGYADALLVPRDGTAVVAATRLEHAEPARVSVVALDASGKRVRTSRLTLHAHSRRAGASALAPGPRGGVLVAGTDVGHREHGWVARLRAGGAVDRSFGRRTIVSRYRDVVITDIARDHRGRIVLAGSRSLYDIPQALAARLTPSGRRDRRFGRDGIVVLQIGSRPKTTLVASQANAVAIDARDRIVLAGVAFDDDAAIREDLGRSYFAVARLKG